MLEKDKMNFERILFSINKIDDYLKNINSPSELYNDSKTFDAVITQFINIGECAYKISEATKNSYKNIEWKKIIGMRNIIAHNYFGIDPRIIWKTKNNDLPKLMNQIKVILEKN